MDSAGAGSGPGIGPDGIGGITGETAVVGPGLARRQARSAGAHALRDEDPAHDQDQRSEPETEHQLNWSAALRGLGFRRARRTPVAARATERTAAGLGAGAGFAGAGGDGVGAGFGVAGAGGVTIAAAACSGVHATVCSSPGAAAGVAAGERRGGGRWRRRDGAGVAT